MLQVAFGQGTDATTDSPRLAPKGGVHSIAISNGTAGVRIAFNLDNAEGLRLQGARDCEKIKPYPLSGQSCCDVPGLLVLNATMSDGSHAWINGTAMVTTSAADGGSGGGSSLLIGEWKPPYCESPVTFLACHLPACSLLPGKA